MNEDPENLIAILIGQAHACRSLGSPFYGQLLQLLATDARDQGPTWNLLGPHSDEPFDPAYHLRLLAGVHRVVLAGSAPELSRHYPSTGGDGDATAAWPAFRDLIASPPSEVLDYMRRPPQTNEVGRSASLAAGVMFVAQQFRLPIRLLEIGSSAGLNLRMDRYWYEQDGVGWGDPDSEVRFSGLWGRNRPPFEASPAIISKRGCDRDPIDLSEEASRLQLLSYVWPGQTERFSLLAAAIEVGARYPVRIDRADGADWLPARLGESQPGSATVVFHSIVWQYLSGATRARVKSSIEEAGGAAKPGTPLAWLRLEPNEAMSWTELRLTTWPGGQERLLATAGFHMGPVRWGVA